MSDYRAFYTASRALVVGVNSYSDPRFMTLGQAEADAQSFGDLLAAPPYEFKVTRLIGPAATKNAILQALFNLRSSEPDDRILFYFAGHGYTLSDLKGNETGLLACVDTVPEQDFTALELDEVIALTRHTPAKHICFIFDACFSGQALGLTRAPAVTADKLMTRRAYQVLTAGAGDQTVSDYRSMTRYMIDGLRSGDLEVDGLTTANELGLYVQQEITRESANNQIPQFGHVRGSQGGDFVFHVDTKVRLPGDLEEALRTSREHTRLGAVVDLIELARSKDEVAEAARSRLEKIAKEDSSSRVRKTAQRFLDGTDVLLKGEAAPPKGKDAAQPPAETETAPLLDRLRRLPQWAIAAGAIGGVAIIAGGILLGSGAFSGGTKTATPTRPGTEVAGVTESPTTAPAPTIPTSTLTDTLVPTVKASPTITPDETSAPTDTPTPLPDVSPSITPTSTPDIRHTGHIVFVSKRDGNPEIYVSNPNGSVTRLTNDPDGSWVEDISPALSRDGTRIAFASDRDGDLEIYTMNVDGSDVEQLTNNAYNDYWPAWSPSGDWLAFASNRSGSSYQVYRMNADPGAGASGSDAELLTGDMANAFWPSVSPDGKRIAFASTQDGNYELYTISANGGDLKRLTEDSRDDITPVWSPDGTKIAFASGPAGRRDIYVMDADPDNGASGGNVKRLTTHPEVDSIPSWSPDGLWIAFGTNRDGNYEIYLMRSADGSGLVDITNNPFADDNPAWGP